MTLFSASKGFWNWVYIRRGFFGLRRVSFVKVILYARLICFVRGFFFFREVYRVVRFLVRGFGIVLFVFSTRRKGNVNVYRLMVRGRGVSNFEMGFEVWIESFKDCSINGFDCRYVFRFFVRFRSGGFFLDE